MEILRVSTLVSEKYQKDLFKLHIAIFSIYANPNAFAYALTEKSRYYAYIRFFQCMSALNPIEIHWRLFFGIACDC